MIWSSHNGFVDSGMALDALSLSSELSTDGAQVVDLTFSRWNLLAVQFWG